jgi:hypothetical protein
VTTFFLTPVNLILPYLFFPFLFLFLPSSERAIKISYALSDKKVVDIDRIVIEYKYYKTNTEEKRPR